MHKFIFAALTAMLCAFPIIALADAPFTIVSQPPQMVSEAELSKAETGRTEGVLSDDKTSLTYHDQTIRLIARTGPEDDMLSYRIQGVRNPILVVPKNATLKILFVNTDEDMTHDIRLGAQNPPFPIAPSVENTVGSAKLPHAENEKYSAQELEIYANATGNFTYLCSVRGHARAGMFGTIAVGVAPAKAPSTPTPPHDSMPGMKMDGMSTPAGKMGAMKMDAMKMRSTADLNDPMSRESSGTSWLPDSSPMYARMRMKGDKMLMLHGMIFPRFTSVGGDRDVAVAGDGGRSRIDAPSMFMAMYSQPLSTQSQLGLRVMLSADPFIEKGYGYPLLYQSGESYRGQPIHDRQHPHDLVSELSVTYSRRLSAHNSAYLYLGYPGEPALGPPTFMHRISAMDDPDAPIGHHWEDSTHVTFGVATLGFSHEKWKLEGSAFKGEEPNENRYDFDSPRLDSFSARLSWNPTSNLALQVSSGVLKNPEPAEPEVSRRVRTTASVIYNKPLGADSNWASTLVWGQNNDTGGERSNAYLLETDYQRRADTVYARLERVQKSGHELDLSSDQIFNVGSYAFGYVRDLKRGKGLDVGVGAQVTFGTNPSGLDEVYGGSNHTGFQVFLRIRPSRLKADESMAGMKM